MSRNELYAGSRVHNFTFPALATGILLGSVVTNFYIGVSKILALTFVSNLAGGAPGTVTVGNIAPAATPLVAGSQGAAISLVSSVNTDTSVYRLSWVNEVAPGSLNYPV